MLSIFEQKYFNFDRTYSNNHLVTEHVWNGLTGINRTSSMPKSILRYVLDKGQYFNLESWLYPILFPK